MQMIKRYLGDNIEDLFNSDNANESAAENVCVSDFPFTNISFWNWYSRETFAVFDFSE